MSELKSYHSLFEKGMKLVEGRVTLDGHELPKPSFFEKRRLLKAVRILEQAANHEPPYGAASLMVAKIYDRLGQAEESLRWMRKAQSVAPTSIIVALDLANSGILPIQFPFVVTLFLGWGFIFASVIMTGLTLGKEGVVSLLKRYLQRRVGWKWYLAAFGLVPVVWIAGVYLYAALTVVYPDFSAVMAYKIFGKSANLPLFVLPFFLVDLISNGEEIGWRGYVLPRLQTKYNSLTSTMILGVVWAFWHLPKFLTSFSILFFAWFILHVMAFAVILTWLYNNTKGSLLLVAIAHAASNTVGNFLPVANTGSGENMGVYSTIVLLELAAAVVVTVISGPAQLSRTEPMQMQYYSQ